MKRFNPALLVPFFAMAPLSLSCVQDNPSVVAIAVDYRYDQEVECQDGKYMSVDLVYPEEIAFGGYHAGVAIENKMLANSPYKSSGTTSSAGSTTIQPTVPDYNAVIIEKFTFRCITGACEGKTGSQSTSFYLPSGGCANPTFVLPKDWIPGAAGDSIQVGITTHYRDSGRLRHETSEVLLTLTLAASPLCKDGDIFDPNEPSLCRSGQ